MPQEQLRRIDIAARADRHVWISDDRVYACIAADCGGMTVDGNIPDRSGMSDAGGLQSTNGITLIGYHGKQPVSRNSIVFRHPGGVLAFLFAETGAGAAADAGTEAAVKWRALPLDDLRWNPSTCRIVVPLSGGSLAVTVSAASHALRVGAWLECSAGDTASPGTTATDVHIATNVQFALRMPAAAVYEDVQGRREWTRECAADGTLRFLMRDIIRFHEWVRRSGPYAGDFLIPEEVRRRVFSRPIRSGLATPADLQPEYAEADFPLYDAAFACTVRGSVPARVLDSGDIEWRFDAAQLAGGTACVDVLFGDEAGDITASPTDAPDAAMPAAVVAAASPAAALLPSAIHAPRLELPSFPQVETFFNDVPGIIDSCWVHTPGMPRSTPGAYYWIWAWDSMATALLFPLWGWRDRMRSVLSFVNEHRDADGAIPMRWTRDLLPLDSPGRGALDFLHAELARRYCAAYGGIEPLARSYMFARQCLYELARAGAESGLVVSPGFYPDLPLAFGRTTASATALETAAFACFCTIMAEWALLFGKEGDHATALHAAERSSQAFLRTFWDERGFFFDAVDTETGRRNLSWPLFTLLFLEAAEGRAMIADKRHAMAVFLRDQLLTDEGLRLLPGWDPARTAESVTSAWYPYWDCHAVRIWRDAGDTASILRWLSAVENALERIGYCPEFLALDVPDDAVRWTRHGAASNINCMAGWYRALLEGIAGIDATAAVPTVLPLALPLGQLRVAGLRFGTTLWDVHVRYGGHAFLGIIVDGGELSPALTVPERFCDGEHHRLEVVYG